ncbi:MAG: hypothetical protein ACRCYD_12640, partial [Plesiomonas sp.]
VTVDFELIVELMVKRNLFFALCWWLVLKDSRTTLSGLQCAALEGYKDGPQAKKWLSAGK